MKCSSESSAIIEAPFSGTDIQQVFFSLPNSKMSGPDGYPGEFFQVHWSAIERDMIDGVNELFMFGFLFKQWNSTITSFVPNSTTQPVSQNAGLYCAATQFIR